MLPASGYIFKTRKMARLSAEVAELYAEEGLALYKEQARSNCKVRQTSVRLKNLIAQVCH